MHSNCAMLTGARHLIAIDPKANVDHLRLTLLENLLRFPPSTNLGPCWEPNLPEGIAQVLSVLIDEACSKATPLAGEGALV